MTSFNRISKATKGYGHSLYSVMATATKNCYVMFKEDQTQKVHVLASKESFNLDKDYLHKNSLLSHKRNISFYEKATYICSYILKMIFYGIMTMNIFELRTSYFYAK